MVGSQPTLLMTVISGFTPVPTGFMSVRFSFRRTHRLRIELTQNTGAAAFDAFLLTTKPFVARGKLKPGQKYNEHPKGWFAFEPT
jgi:hypothetical protein